jgi:hypothetical protein
MVKPQELLRAVTFVALAGLSTSMLFAAEPIALRSAKPDGSTQRVVVNLQVGGNLKVSAETKAGDKSGDQVPMSVVAQFDYEEQRIDDGKDADHRLAIRSYNQSQAVLKIGDTVTKPQLRDTRKLIAVVANKDDVYLSATSGPLTRDELELIDIPANSLIIDQILPQDDVKVGYRWKPSAEAMARLLAVDAVAKTDAECVLVDAKDGAAEITLEGPVQAAIDGVSTDMEVKGKLIYDMAASKPKSLLLAIKEVRDIGQVGPGVDVVAKLKLTFAPVTESKQLTAEAVQSAELPKSDQAPPLEYVSDTKGFHFVYGRKWHITRDDAELVVMRLIDRGDLVTQCNLSLTSLPNPPVDPKDPQTAKPPMELSQFQSDVQSALGKLFGRFERASERPTDTGLRLLQAIVAGNAQDVPIQWRYNLLHDKQGRAITVIFTMEAPRAEQFGDQDKPLLNSIEFVEAKVASSQSKTKKK